MASVDIHGTDSREPIDPRPEASQPKCRGERLRYRPPGDAVAREGSHNGKRSGCCDDARAPTDHRYAIHRLSRWQEIRSRTSDPRRSVLGRPRLNWACDRPAVAWRAFVRSRLSRERDQAGRRLRDVHDNGGFPEDSLWKRCPHFAVLREPHGSASTVTDPHHAPNGEVPATPSDDPLDETKRVCRSELPPRQPRPRRPCRRRGRSREPRDTGVRRLGRGLRGWPRAGRQDRGRRGAIAIGGEPIRSRDYRTDENAGDDHGQERNGPRPEGIWPGGRATTTT